MSEPLRDALEQIAGLRYWTVGSDPMLPEAELAHRRLARAMEIASTALALPQGAPDAGERTTLIGLAAYIISAAPPSDARTEWIARWQALVAGASLRAEPQ